MQSPPPVAPPVIRQSIVCVAQTANITRKIVLMFEWHGWCYIRSEMRSGFRLMDALDALILTVAGRVKELSDAVGEFARQNLGDGLEQRTRRMYEPIGG